MIQKTSRLITALIIVALCLYVVILNSTVISVNFSPNRSISAYTGVVLITVFLAGVVATFLVSAWFAMRSAMRERRLLKQERERLVFFKKVSQARGLLASGSWEQAEAAWQELLRQDPTNVMIRMDLSRTLEGAGNLAAALKIVDEARAAEPENLEVLFRAAELQVLLNNKTAAIDNLALVLYQQPNRRAAAWARDLSEDLGRIDDALEYQQRLEAIGLSAEHSAVRARLELKQMLATQNEADEESRELALKELKRFAKKHPASFAAHREVAQRLEERGELLEAADHYDKALRLSGAVEDLQALTDMLINGQLPERALSKARAAVRNLNGRSRILCELELIRVLVSLNLVDEALPALDNVRSLAAVEEVPIDQEIESTLLILRGQCLVARGENREAALLWKEL